MTAVATAMAAGIADAKAKSVNAVAAVAGVLAERMTSRSSSTKTTIFDWGC